MKSDLQHDRASMQDAAPAAWKSQGKEWLN